MPNVIKHHKVMCWKNRLSIDCTAWPSYLSINEQWICYLIDSPCPIKVDNLEILLIQVGNHDVHISNIAMHKTCLVEFLQLLGNEYLGGSGDWLGE